MRGVAMSHGQQATVLADLHTCHQASSPTVNAELAQDQVQVQNFEAIPAKASQVRRYAWASRVKVFATPLGTRSFEAAG